MTPEFRKVQFVVLKTKEEASDIKKKIDRLDSEGVSSLRERYKERYGEELAVPDLHSENVREALEDVKPYLDIDEFDEKAADDDKKEEEEAEEAEEEKKEKGEEGPSFFAKIIAAIKAFFASIFSRKEKKEASAKKVEEAVAVSNGE